MINTGGGGAAAAPGRRDENLGQQLTNFTSSAPVPTICSLNQRARPHSDRFTHLPGPPLKRRGRRPAASLRQQTRPALPADRQRADPTPARRMYTPALIYIAIR